MDIVTMRHVAGIHDHHGAPASHAKKAAIGGLLYGLAVNAGAKQRFLGNFGADATAAIKMRDPAVAMPPHARHCAHALDGIAQRAAIDRGKAGRHAKFDKLAHQAYVPVGHAADMAAIIMGDVADFREQHVLQRFNPRILAAKRRFGKRDAAQRADLLVDRAHAPPVHCQTAELHLDRMRKPRLEGLVGGIAVPAIIHRDDRQPLAHQVGPPVGKFPGRIRADPVGDQVACAGPCLDAAFGAQVAKPGKGSMGLVAGGGR